MDFLQQLIQSGNSTAIDVINIILIVLVAILALLPTMFMLYGIWCFLTRNRNKS